MSWNPLFYSKLFQPHLKVNYRLSFVGLQNNLGEPFEIYSDRGSVQIETRSVRITGTRITPQRWSVTFGSFSLNLTGDIRYVLPKMRRGQIAILLCTINDSPLEMLSIGSLSSLSGQRGQYTLVFKDLLSTLQNSLDTQAGTANSETDKPHFNLFYEVGRTTTTTTDFTTTDTTLNVEDASFFKKAGNKGIVKCIPTSGDTFYIFWEGSTSTSLTTCSTANYNNTSRDSTLPSGSTIQYCAWLEGQPYEILASILTSTGNGTNGAFDTYPLQWTIGGGLNSRIFDVSDSERASKQIVRSDGGVYDLGIAIESPLNNGLRYFSDLFSEVGIFPVYRQNAISIRCCTDPEGKETRKEPDIRARISDKDIIDVISHDFFNQDISNIYRTTKVFYDNDRFYYSGGNYNSALVDSLPALSENIRNNNIYYLRSPDNKKEAALQDLRRLRVWDLYISEKLVVRLPLYFSHLCAGDVVTFISSYTEHLYDPINPIFRGRYCLVFGVDYSIDSQECYVTLGISSPKMQGTTDEELTNEEGYQGWYPNETYNNTEFFIWLDSEVNMNESGGDVTSWVDRQNSFSFSNQAGNNNDYNTGASLPSKQATAGGSTSGFNFARFLHTNHEFLATDYNSKMDLSSTNGLCVVMLVRAYNDPIGDIDFNGGNYYKAPLINCGRSYQLHFLDSFSGSTYTNAIGFDNNSNTINEDNLISPPDSNWKILIFNGADVGGYTSETGIYINGTNENATNYAPTNVDISTSPDFRIGRDPDISYSNQTQQFGFAFGSFDLAELLIFSIPLHDNEREKVEGYIAHKYNLTSLLPSSHPYKTTIPT